VNPRPYQEDARRKVYKHFNSRSEKGAMVCLPTGTGKTASAMFIVRDALDRGQRVLWLAHTRELVTQPIKTLLAIRGAKSSLVTGVVMGGSKDFDKQMVFASVQTMRSEAVLSEYLSHGAPRLVVYDEAHHTASDEYQTVMSALQKQEPKPFALGLTATPERTDTKSLSKDWEIVASRSVFWAIENGFLVPFESVVERLAGLDLPETTREDYNDAELAEALLAAHVVEHTVEAINKHAKTRTGVCFTASVQQAQETAAALVDEGYVARWVSGNMPRSERDAILKGLADGKIQWVCNAMLLTEGWDCPRVDCAVVARPTRSKSLWIQMAGRALRANWPGKESALIIDIAGASDEFGMIIAPVLIDALKEEEKSRCSYYEDGNHRYEPITDFSKACACGKEVTNSGEDPKSILEGLLKKRKRTKATWLELRGLDRETYVCDCGEHGLVYVTQDLKNSSLYWSHLLLPRKRKPTLLAEIPVDIGLAYGIGDDVVRRAAALTKPGSSWRSKKPTEKQTAAAMRKGMFVKPDMDAGQVSDMLASSHARERAIKVGLAKSVA